MNNKNDANKLNDMFYKIYINLLIDKDQHKFINKLHELIENSDIIDFQKIKNINCLLIHTDNNIMFAHKIISLHYVKSIILLKLKNYINSQTFRANKQDLSKTPVESTIFLLEKNKMILNAFKTINIPYNDEKMDSWYEETKIEAINRLKQLSKYFNKIYKLYEIDIFLKKNIEDTKPLIVIDFYNNTIKIIGHKINDYIATCNDYIKLDTLHNTIKIDYYMKSFNKKIETTDKFVFSSEDDDENDDKIKLKLKNIVDSDEFYNIDK